MSGSHLKFVLAMLCFGSLASGMLAGCANAEPAQLLFEANVAELPSEAMMDATREIVVRRIEALGVAGARVERDGAKRILVRLDSRADEGAVRALLDRRGRIEFRLVDINVTQVTSRRAGRRSAARSSPVRRKGRAPGSPSIGARSSAAR